MKQKIKTYNLFTYTLKIVYKDKVEDSDGNWMYGQCNWDASNVTIEVSTKSNDDRKLRAEEIEATLRHELFPFILDVLQYRSLSADEALVEWLANATLTLNKQGLSI